MHGSLDQLRALVERSLLTDRARLGGSLRSLTRRLEIEEGRTEADPAIAGMLRRDFAHLEHLLVRSSNEVERRRGLRPSPEYAPQLPVTAALDQIRAALAAASVVIVA